jgi:hypothetical protein
MFTLPTPHATPWPICNLSKDSPPSNFPESISISIQREIIHSKSDKSEMSARFAAVWAGCSRLAKHPKSPTLLIFKVVSTISKR